MTSSREARGHCQPRAAPQNLRQSHCSRAALSWQQTSCRPTGATAVCRPSPEGKGHRGSRARVQAAPIRWAVLWRG
eukprot:11733466-Karenia_brevis.AAC.1